MISINILILLALIGIMEYNTIEALQCYVCENCIEGEELQELHICGASPIGVQSTTARPAAASTTSTRRTTTTTRRTTTSSGLDTDSEDYDYSEEDENEVQSATTIATTTIAATTRRTTTIINNQEDDYDYSEDYDYGERRRNNNKISKFMLWAEGEPICYTIQLKVNDTIVTNRGCTTLINGNKSLTCHALNRGLDVYNCQLCYQNGCNKATTEDMMINDPYWNGAEDKFVNHSLMLLIVVFSMRYLV